MLGAVSKSPGSKFDYDVDMAKWLSATDRVTALTATISGGTATLPSSSYTDRSLRFWVEGGADGETNTVEFTAATLEGRKLSEAFRVRIQKAT